MDTKLIVQQFNNLYVLYRKKFLIMDKYGYRTIESTKGKTFNLTDYNLIRHLEEKQTIGVFAGTKYSKFICFDVDVTDEDTAKWVTYKLINTLISFGVPSKYINVSISGSKGYHIEIFFNKPISNKDIKEFFQLVIYEADLLNIDGNVEFRPSFELGVKIPLGKHFKTSRTCWYCDYKKRLEPIRNYDHILTIQQMDSEYFFDLLERSRDSVDITGKQIEDVKQVIKTVKPLTIYEQNIDEEATTESIENLIKNGLKGTGRRHNSLLKIAKYNKYLGMNLDENKEYLINWLQIQDKNTYKTRWNDCLKDIEEIANWVYQNNCSLIVKKNNIKVQEHEIKELLKLHGSSKKLVFYALLVHCKKYSNAKGKFYMTGLQLVESTGLSEKTIWNTIKQLEEAKYISVFRNKSVYDYVLKKPISKPNEYIINIPSNNDDSAFEVCSDNTCTNCLSVCLSHLIEDKDLRKALTRREYQTLIAKQKHLYSNCQSIIKASI